jgi:hypothetical protein
MVTVNAQFTDEQELNAVHVTTVGPVANVEPDDGVHVTVAAGAPEAVGSIHVATWLSHCVISEGHPLSTGDSLIVTLNVHVEVPHVFEAVHVTTVVPVAKKEPDAGEQLTVAAGVPVAEGVLKLTVWLSHWTISPGHAPITGESLMVTVKEHEELPQELLAVHVTVVVPAANVDPESGEHVTVAAGDADETGSVHVAM